MTISSESSDYEPQLHANWAQTVLGTKKHIHSRILFIAFGVTIIVVIISVAYVCRRDHVAQVNIIAIRISALRILFQLEHGKVAGERECPSRLCRG